MPRFTILPSPPPPLGYDQWPVPPAEQVCWTESLPDARVLPPSPGMPVGFPIGTLKNQTLTVYGQYTPLLQGTVTPQTSPLTRTVSVTRGTSTKVSESTTISLSFGVSIPGLFDLGAKIDETVGFSQTWMASTTTQDEFVIKADKGKVSAIWWQASYRYVFNATVEAFGQFGPIMNMIVGTYPKQMILACDTFTSSQYPADSSASMSFLRGK